MARRCISLTLIVMVLIMNKAIAEKLELPSQLAEISEEAFAGNSSVTEVIIPDGTLVIGDFAFSDCTNLGWISIPASVESLGEGFVNGCADDLLIRTTSGSAACQYAQLNLIDYQAETKYRALIIGQTYPDIPALKLYGPDNDIVAMSHCLELFEDTPYQTTVRMNLTADEILGAITDTFSSAAEEDVSLFYYSGHGVSSDDSSQQGALLGADNEGNITATQLRNALDQIAGRKIVIIDACYSGSVLSENRALFSNSAKSSITETDQPAESFVDSFISAFSRKKRSNLASDGYYVLTAAAADEESYENQVGDRIMGLFTYNLVLGCGYDAYNECSATLLADGNDNGVLTLQEIFQYTRKSLIIEGQHARVYPDECSWFGLLRQ